MPRKIQITKILYLMELINRGIKICKCEKWKMKLQTHGRRKTWLHEVSAMVPLKLRAFQEISGRTISRINSFSDKINISLPVRVHTTHLDGFFSNSNDVSAKREDEKGRQETVTPSATKALSINNVFT